MRPFIMTFLVLAAGCSFNPTQGYVHQAESLAQDGRYEEAIAAYRAHMEERRAVADRPTWENPAFYLLAIGDIQLEQNEPAVALATYEEAEREGVEATLVTDRYLALAVWYEKQERFKDALDVLRVHRLRDPELLNGTFTRIAKKLVDKEEADAGR